MGLAGCFDTYWTVRKKWASQPGAFYWGDHLDARYYLLFLLRESINGKRVLDIGAGTGIVLSELSESNMRVGVDIDDAAIACARAMDKSVFYLKADTLSLPFKKNSFDAVLFNSMLWFFSKEKLRSIFDEAYGLLKDGGVLYISTANRDSFSYKNLENALRFEELRGMLDKHFKAIHVRFFNIIPNFPFGPPNILYDLLLRNRLTFKMLFAFLTRVTSPKGKWFIVSASK